jgi:hypothetical protein
VRELTPEETEAVDRVARFVVRFGLAMPAILWLESMRPLTFVGSQFMHVLSPSVTAFLPINEWDALARLLEEREGLEVLITRIEALDREVPA